MQTNAELQTLIVEVAKIINVDPETLDPDMPLGQLGIDSFNIVELIMVCHQLFPNITNLESINFHEHSTLREVEQLLNKERQHA